MVDKYRSGAITRQQAMKEIEQIKQDAVKSLKKDPEKLARTKQHSTDSKSKGQSSSNKSTATGSGSDKDGKGPRY